MIWVVGVNQENRLQGSDTVPWGQAPPDVASPYLLWDVMLAALPSSGTQP